MREGWAIVLAAVALSGCATTGGLLTAADAGLPGAPLSFGAPVAMAQPTSGAEPNVAVLPDGTILITAVAGSQERPNHEQGAAWLWRSTDGGATWETLRAPQRDTPLGTAPGTRRPFGSSDADVIGSPDGWAYYSDWWNWGAPVAPVPGQPGLGLPISPYARYGSYLVERSADGGKTWESTPVTTLDSFGGVDRQWLVAGEDGWVALFYAYFHGPNPSRPGDISGLEGASSIQAVYSKDHGATWSDPMPVVGPTAEGFSQIAHPRLTLDGRLWMPHGYTANGETYWTDPSEVRVAISQDLGATWDDVKVADVPEGFDNLWAVQGDSEPDGTMHVAWAARAGKLMIVQHSESRDGGATWSAPENVSAPGIAFLPWVAARDGEVAVAYYWADAWGEPTQMPDEVAWYPVVARKPTGGAWALANASAEPVKTGPMCPRGAACPSDRELLDYPSVAFAADGRLVAAYATSREVAGAKAGQVVFVAST